MNNTVSTTEELYATVPMNAVQMTSFWHAGRDSFSTSIVADEHGAYGRAKAAPTCVQSNEEEVYTAFEQAISERCIAFRGYLAHSSASMLASSPRRQTEPIVHNAFPTRVMAMKETSNSCKAATLHEQIKHLRQMLLISFALICILVGFDVMGLLVLYVR